MRAKTVAVLLLLVSVCCAMGWRRQPKVKDVDLSSARIGEKDAVSIDGKADEQAWRKAVVIPFEKTGEAKFVWDQAKLYGFVSKYEHQRSGLDMDEQICVAVQVGNRVAKLYFEERPREGGSVLGLRAAWAAERPIETASRVTLKSELVAAESCSGTAKRGWHWSVEFSLDWSSVAPSQPGNEPTTIRIYRLIPQRPITHVLRMEATGQKTAGKQAAGTVPAERGPVQR